MATVTAYTAQKTQEVFGASVVSASINQSNGHLVFQKGNGSSVDAGKVVPDVPAAPNVPKAYESWGIGAVYISFSATSPATLLGGGTWERVAQGRVLVGVNENDSRFDSAGDTGGENEHAITVNEMPFHNHGGGTGGQSAQHAHGQVVTVVSAGSGNRQDYVKDGGFASVYPQNVSTYSADTDHSHAIPGQGGGAAMSLLQPYLAVYMWRRTA